MALEMRVLILICLSLEAVLESRAWCIIKAHFFMNIGGVFILFYFFRAWILEEISPLAQLNLIV